MAEPAVSYQDRALAALDKPVPPRPAGEVYCCLLCPTPAVWVRARPGRTGDQDGYSHYMARHFVEGGEPRRG